jgi:hypothetical protein
MKNKSIIVLFIAVSIMLILSSCKSSKNVVVNLITKSESSEEIEYVSIYSNGKAKKIDPFVTDDFQRYSADSRSFSSYISNNTVFNRLNKIVIEDSSGNIVDNDEIITGIFKSAESLEHDIWEFQIFKVLDDYFALVKLNVNWQSPCDFYYYNKTDKTLKLLERFEGVDIIGISLPKE